MKTEFKREMNRNYMVLHPEKEIGGSYALRMLSENRINGLLPFQEKRIHIDHIRFQTKLVSVHQEPFQCRHGDDQITGDLPDLLCLK